MKSLVIALSVLVSSLFLSSCTTYRGVGPAYGGYTGVGIYTAPAWRYGRGYRSGYGWRSGRYWRGSRAYYGRGYYGGRSYYSRSPFRTVHGRSGRGWRR